MPQHAPGKVPVPRAAPDIFIFQNTDHSSISCVSSSLRMILSASSSGASVSSCGSSAAGASCSWITITRSRLCWASACTVTLPDSTSRDQTPIIATLFQTDQVVGIPLIAAWWNLCSLLRGCGMDKEGSVCRDAFCKPEASLRLTAVCCLQR